MDVPILPGSGHHVPMPDAPSLPAGLRPDDHEHGLASGPVDGLAEVINRAWVLFESVARDADLAAPSRKDGYTGRQIVARLGQWPSGRTLTTMLEDAHDGDADYFDADAVDAAVLAETAELSDEDVLDGVARARATTAQWLASDGPATWGLVRTSSPLGPLPVLTVMNAMTYQLAIASLDLEPCSVQAPEELMTIGLAALIDTTGALAGRKHATGSFVAVTPEGVVGAGAHRGHWRTAVLEQDPHHGPTVLAPARTIIDVTSGRANVPNLYRTGALHVRDLPGLVRLAPVLEGVPGIPPLGAVGKAVALMESVGGLLGRFRR